MSGRSSSPFHRNLYKLGRYFQALKTMTCKGFIQFTPELTRKKISHKETSTYRSKTVHGFSICSILKTCSSLSNLGLDY